MNQKAHPFGNGKEAFLYAALVVLIMWLVYWADSLFEFHFYTLGVLPRSVEGLKGIFFMPWIHSDHEIQHIINNSFPTFFLTATLVYFYREIALKIFLLGWFFTGLALWIYAPNNGSYHIGMSGVIYVLAGFLFTSGVLRQFLPLQSISLFIVFVYGSMIWGIFPMNEKVSWEGHLMGLFTGIILAYLFRKNGPQRPKYQYEIEKEMGIEPPDLEAILNEKILHEQEAEQAKKEMITVQYHYVESPKKHNGNSVADDV
jgi:membrane associated rhomboid family serine protease